jgi:hypothetical protein
MVRHVRHQALHRWTSRDTKLALVRLCTCDLCTIIVGIAGLGLDRLRMESSSGKIGKGTLVVCSKV